MVAGGGLFRMHFLRHDSQFLRDVRRFLARSLRLEPGRSDSLFVGLVVDRLVSLYFDETVTHRISFALSGLKSLFLPVQTFSMTKFISKLFVLTMFALVAGCGCDPPPFPVAEQKAALPTIQSTDDLVVYLDTSASMAGYVSPTGPAAFGTATADGKTVYTKAILDIRDVIVTMAPQPRVWVRTVDSKISAPVDGMLRLSEASMNKARFVGTETDLVSAIKTFSQPLEPSSGTPPPRFLLMITDGVQSSGGTDPLIIKNELKKLMNAGWGGTILGIRSEFSGKIFREIKSGSVPYVSGKDRSRFRPFYIYVFSPDRAALDNLVSSLRQRFQEFAKDDTLRVYPLTSPYSEGNPTIEVQPSASDGNLEIQTHLPMGGSNPGITICANENMASKEQFTLSIKPEWSPHALLAGTAGELAGTLKWEILPLPPSPDAAGLLFPDFKKVNEKVENGTTSLTFEVGWPASAITKGWSTYRLVGKLAKIPPWVSNWSTQDDTSADDGNKTLFIASSVENLWQNSSQDYRPVVELDILVGP